VDDFSAARNAALALSDADWNLVLDADETLVEGGGEALAGLRQQAPTFVGSIEVCSDYQVDPATGHMAQAASWLPRVLPRGARFEGRIHEQAVYAGPRQRLPVRVSHDGYLPEHMASKGSRNLHLLQLALQASPSDPYLHYQLGKDHEVHDRFEMAWPHYEQALQLLPVDAGRHPAWRHDLILRALYTLKATGQLAQAIDLAQTEMPHWHDSPDFYFVLGDVLLDHAVAHPEQAAELLPMIRSAWVQCLAIGENPALEGAVRGRGSDLPQRQLALLDQIFGPGGATGA
jgi:tetratricopeptide (TPR) repeat protein